MGDDHPGTVLIKKRAPCHICVYWLIKKSTSLRERSGRQSHGHWDKQEKAEHQGRSYRESQEGNIFQNRRTNEMCQVLLRVWDDVDWFFYFCEDASKIHGLQVLLLLCRKRQNQLAGDLILNLLFSNAEIGNIRISSLSQWELRGDAGEKPVRNMDRKRP